MKMTDFIIKPKGVTKKWSCILTFLYYFLLGTYIISWMYRDNIFWFILMGMTLLAAIVFGVLMWFYYNLPHKLNMLEQEGVQVSDTSTSE